MKDYKKPNRFGGERSGGNGGGGGFERREFSRPSFGGRPDFKRGGGDSRDFNKRPEMHKATCANCGKTCEVPFRPNGEKPVYCNDCFGSKREGGASQNFSKKDFAPREQYAPRQEGGDRRIDDLKKQIDGLHTKLDRVLEMMKPANKQAASPSPEVALSAMIATQAKNIKVIPPAPKKTAKVADKKKKPAAKKK